MQAVILAGGLGTRIQKAFPGIPKALIPAGGTPFIAHQLKLLRRNQIRKVLLLLGRHAEAIKGYVGSGSEFDLEVDYSIEAGDQLMGTGGAIRLAHDNGKLDPAFLLMNGDSFIPTGIQDLLSHCAVSRAKPVAMTLYRNQDRFEPSNVALLAGGTALYDKARTQRQGISYTHIDAGLLLIRRDWIVDNFFPSTKIDLSERLMRLSQEGRLLHHEIEYPHFEIGSPEGHARMTQGLKPLILLDRDGIINEEVHASPKSPTGRAAPLKPEEVRLRPDAVSVLRNLIVRGCRLAICTNQPGAAKGEMTMEALKATHARVLSLLHAQGVQIQASYLCLHRAEDLCKCRKPKPGLLIQAIQELGAVRPDLIWFVGDRETDRDAAIAARVRPAWVNSLTEFMPIYDREEE